MSKFNTSRTAVRVAAKVPDVLNLAGGRAFSLNAKEELATILLTCFVSESYYRTKDEGITRVQALIDALPDKKFAAQAAVYARTRMGMRSITHLVAGELAHSVKGASWMKPFMYQVTKRVDDMTEIVAYYLGKYGKPLPNSIRKGLAVAFNKFNAYQLAKYRGEGSALSLVDLVNLVHPKPVEQNAEALKALMHGELTSTDTWESQLSAAGQEASGDETKLAELKGAAWAKLVGEDKLGYLAMLRNLRNIIEQAPEQLDVVLARLCEPERVAKSLTMPHQFYLAMVAVLESIAGRKIKSKVEVALSKAMDLTVLNVPKLGGRTAILVDCSGSMNTLLTSAKSRAQVFDVAVVMGAILSQISDESDMYLFAETAKGITIMPNQSTMQLTGAIKRTAPRGGTDLSSAFKSMKNRKYDRVFCLSDMQSWGETSWRGTSTSAEWDQYCTKTKTQPILYSWDLTGFGSILFPRNRIFLLAGVSGRVFDFMAEGEKDRGAMIREIEKISL